ncbi:MAG TPA: PAS domain-containing protein [Xanthobacteraceae bacterium]|nr:PAS domain-containing protein [Xanthobacteraceae bacterium]
MNDRRKHSRVPDLIWRQRFPSFSPAAHVFALACVAAAIGLNLAVEAPGFRIAPFSMLLIAVMISAIAGGTAAGLTALIAGGIAARLILLPVGAFLVTEASRLTGLAIYAVTGLFIILLVALTRRAAMQLEVSRASAREEHDRLVSALEASGAGTWRWDIQNDVVEWDDALCRMYGMERKDAPRSSAGFFAIVHPDDQQHAGEVVRRCIAGADVEYEFRAVVPKGTLRIYDRSRCVRDAEGRPAYMLGACLDVTERRHLEEERGRIATWLTMAMEVAQIGTWEIDPQSQSVTASPSMNAMFGLPADGKPRPFQDYLDVIHPDDAGAVQAAIARRAEKLEPVSVEYRLMRQGETRWLASRGAFVRAADGSGRIVGSLYDITDRKRIEQDREAALRQRELLLKELNHRVKNNLQMVSSLLNLQATRMDDPAAKEQFRKAIDRVQAVGDIHARLYQGEQLGLLDFDQYLMDLCSRLRESTLDGRSIRLDVEVEPMTLDIDRAIPLGLIVNELVTNSIKHAFPPGARGTIEVKLKKGGAGEVLRLSIADDGGGIADQGARDGLGTRLIEGLMQQLGGRIERRDDSGVCYEIVVPERADVSA